MGETFELPMTAVSAGTPSTQQIAEIPATLPSFILGRITLSAPSAIAAQGGTNFATLAVRQLRGGAVVSTLVTRPFSITGLAAETPETETELYPSPQAPTVVNNSAAGATTRSYQVVPVFSTGATGAAVLVDGVPSAATAPSTLNAAPNDTITCAPVPGAVWYKLLLGGAVVNLPNGQPYQVAETMIGGVRVVRFDFTGQATAAYVPASANPVVVAGTEPINFQANDILDVQVTHTGTGGALPAGLLVTVEMAD